MGALALIPEPGPARGSQARWRSSPRRAGLGADPAWGLWDAEWGMDRFRVPTSALRRLREPGTLLPAPVRTARPNAGVRVGSSEFRGIPGRVLRRAVVCGALLAVSLVREAAGAESDAHLARGVWQVISGVALEPPLTVIETTLSGAPVVGTCVGVLAGAARGLQHAVAGGIEVVRALVNSCCL